MDRQQIFTIGDSYKKLDDFFKASGVKKIFLVCGQAIKNMNIGSYFNSLGGRTGIKVVPFHDFIPNPLYDSVCKGVHLFHKEKCDMIAAVGGGSAIDVAKCIKLFANMDETKSYLLQEIVPNEIRLLAVPTTAGTGSEATRFAVIYDGGEKQSISDESCIPSVVVMDPSTLKTLPEYHRKATMLDAFCHAIESFWSIHSTRESQNYSMEAIKIILENKDLYLANKKEGNQKMLLGAHIAGKAINIAQTTAGHAMCYKLTSLYGIAHGHAAALCVSRLWPYMVSNLKQCVDPRGEAYLSGMFSKLAAAMGCTEINKAIDQFMNLLDELGMAMQFTISNRELDILKKSVNPIRLRNTPVSLGTEAIDFVYRQILDIRQEGGSIES